MPMIETRDGTRLYVKSWGEGRPVYLLHGWPLNADTWDDIGIALAQQGLRAIAYDRRGFGRSDQPWMGYEYDTLADDLADVIAQTDGNDAALVGFSMGGGEVARYLSRYGAAKVRHAALISSIVPYMLHTSDNPNGVDPDIFRQMQAGLAADRAEFFTGFFQDFYGVGLLSQPVSDEVLIWSQNIAMMAGLHATQQCASAFARTDFRSELPAFSVPTLIIHGTSDNTVPIDASARPAAKAIASSVLKEYDGAPHGLQATHKTELAQDLIEFLAR